MLLRRHLLARTSAILVLAGSAVVIAPTVLHDRVLATSSHQTANQNSDVYIAVPDRPGSQVDALTPTYALHSFSWGLQNSGGPAGPKFSEASIAKAFDSTSLALFSRLTGGPPYPPGPYTQLEISFATPASSSAKPFVYLTYLLGQVRVTSLSYSGSAGGGGVEETATLNFDSVKVTSSVQTPTGAVKTTSQCWSVVSNSATCP